MYPIRLNILLKLMLFDRRLPLTKLKQFSGLLFVFIMLALMAETTQGAQSVSVSRLQRLSRGVNLSFWLWLPQVEGYGYTNFADYFNAYITDADLATLRAMGLEHVRLPIDPALLFNENDPTTLNAENIAYVDRAIDMILANDLAVIVDMHSLPDLNERLALDDAFVERFAAYWRTLAAHLSSRDPEMVFLEVLNEPAFVQWVANPAQRWPIVQERLLNAMREGAPEHTLIATGHDWSSMDSLMELTPVADANVVYNFHFYEPHTFTHQGATWGDPIWTHLFDIPYPPTQENIGAILPSLDSDGQQAAQQYEQEGWDASVIDSRINEVAIWRELNGVNVISNEFGAFRDFASPQDRAHWISDARQALERYNIGWTMWDYTGNFGLMEEKAGQRRADPLTVEALGLPA